MIIEFLADGPEPGRIFHVIGSYEPAMAKTLRDAGRPFILRRRRPDFDPAAEGYVAGRRLKRRPAMPVALSKTAIAADGRDAALLTGIPAGAVVTVDDQPVEHDGVLELIAEMPATYAVAITCWPHLEWAAEITAS